MGRISMRKALLLVAAATICHTSCGFRPFGLQKLAHKQTQVKYSEERSVSTQGTVFYSQNLNKENDPAKGVDYAQAEEDFAKWAAEDAAKLAKMSTNSSLPVDSPTLASESESAAPVEKVEVPSSAIAKVEDEAAAAAALAEMEESALAEPVNIRPKFYARDFVNSTWVVGRMWDNKAKWDQTKVYLRDDGTCVWLDGGKGTWKLRTRYGRLAIYRDFWLGWKGKRIYSVALDEPRNICYLQGEIKGWGPWFMLNIMGYWQAVRLDEKLISNFNTAPWEEVTEENDPDFDPEADIYVKEKIKWDN